MRTVAMVVGLLFLVGGALGLTYHVSLYLNGSYEGAARLQNSYHRILTVPPHPTDEQYAVRAAEFVQEKLIYGSVYAGVPIVLGGILLLVAWRWKSGRAAGVSPGTADGAGAV